MSDNFDKLADASRLAVNIGKFATMPSHLTTNLDKFAAMSSHLTATAAEVSRLTAAMSSHLTTNFDKFAAMHIEAVHRLPDHLLQDEPLPSDAIPNDARLDGEMPTTIVRFQAKGTPSSHPPLKRFCLS
jgi:hypothetical protein